MLSRSIRPFVGLVLLALASPVGVDAAAAEVHLLRTPAVSKTRIAFSYGGDLWIVGREGGDARRLTTDGGTEMNPLFSPDGATIAFSGQYDNGNWDVYTIPAEGGIPRRLTSHPSADQVAGWTRDGKRILFRSPRDSHSGYYRLYTVGVEGGLPEELPLPMGFEAAYSPDGARLAYVPFTNFGQSASFARGLKHYRGGLASPVWIARLSDSVIEKIPRTDSNDTSPLWIGDKVYFLSDRGGTVAIWQYDTTTKQLKQALRTGEHDIKSMSAGPDAIVYEQLGSISLFDPATGKRSAVNIRVSGDFPKARPRFESVGHQVQNANISPTGARAVFEAHGEIFTVPVKKGDTRNLTRSSGAADRDPAWSPDGKWIAWLSDGTGEYQLWLRDQDGLGEAKKIELGEPSFYYSPTWSPDSKKILYSDKRLNLWYVDIAGGKPVKVDTAPYDGGGFAATWSPDSRWITYQRALDSGMGAVFIHSLEQKKSFQITDGMSDAGMPEFDRAGRYLYFTASTDIGPAFASSMASFKIAVTRSVYAVVLSKDLRSPLAPQSDEETVKVAGEKPKPANPAEDDGCKEDAPGAGADPKPDDAGKDAKKKDDKKDKKDAKDDKKEDDAPKPVKIDLEGIDQRIVGLPMPARNYWGLYAGKANKVFLIEGPAGFDGSTMPRTKLHLYDVCKREPKQVLENMGGFRLSANAEKALYEQLPPPDPYELPTGGGGPPHPGTWSIKPVDSLGSPGEPGKPDGTLKLDGMEVWIEPRAEWNQIFRETLRIQRDYFYDPNQHGADLKALQAQYQPFVDGVMSRPDLTYVMADLLGEVTAQHIYLGGGDLPQLRYVQGGLLGADYEIANGRYRFKKIYRGENWNPGLRAPLTEPGVNVKEGEYLLAVNGRDLRAANEVYALFESTAGKSVQLLVGADPGGKGARSVNVVPIPDESSLRLRAWMDHNRLLVEKLGGGKVAYVYLPDTAVDGYTNFNRYYFPQGDRQAAVIDERFNGGGWIADYVVDWLRRPRLMSAMTREGKDTDVPMTIFGPKVMLINEHAGSGGDALPWMFRRLGIGPLIGTRTWGGLIGIGGYPSLIDGGFITAPRWAIYNPDTGEFDVENKGVAPDIEVDLDPAEWRKGRDPQLEKGVEVVLELLKKSPPPPAKRPKYPVYDWRSSRAKEGAEAPK